MNKKNVLLAVLLACASLSFAAERVKLKDGRTAILNDNFTWKYEGVSERPSTGMDASRTEKLELGKTGYVLYYDPTVWIKTKTEGHRVTFRHKDGDVYATTIPERLEIPIETLKMVAIENAKSAAQDAAIVGEEWKVVNGTKLLNMQIGGSMSGIPFYFYGYYFSGSKGTIQLLTWTSKNLFKEYKGDMTKFLDGLIVSE